MSEARETIVPARYGRAVRVDAREVIEIVSPAGAQCGDVWAFSRADPHESMSMVHSRSVNSRSWPDTGQAFVSTRRRPMLRMLEDTSPGPHDTLLCACSREIYVEHGCRDDHRNCEDNLHEALAEVGVAIPYTPDPFNIFMNVVLAPDFTVVRGEPTVRAGDHVALGAEMDLWVVISACPQDVTIINSEDRTPKDLLVRVKPAA